MAAKLYMLFMLILLFGCHAKHDTRGLHVEYVNDEALTGDSEPTQDTEEENLECENDSSYNVAATTQYTITHCHSFWEYCPGAAHGAYGATYANKWLNEARTDEISLSDVLDINDSVKAIATRHYLIAKGYIPEDIDEIEAFSFPDNFIIDTTQITFVYQLYEAGSYMEGMIEFSIPYNELAPHLKPEFQWLLH